MEKGKLSKGKFSKPYKSFWKKKKKSLLFDQHHSMGIFPYLNQFRLTYFYVGCSGSSWNLVIKVSNIDIILSCFDISQVDIFKEKARKEILALQINC